MTTTPSISGGRSHVLLHAETCKQLGLIRYPVNSSTAELKLLPQLPLSTSQQWLHTHELVGPTVPDHAATPDGVFDLMDASAAVAVRANVEKVLLCTIAILDCCNDEPFPDVGLLVMKKNGNDVAIIRTDTSPLAAGALPAGCWRAVCVLLACCLQLLAAAAAVDVVVL